MAKGPAATGAQAMELDQTPALGGERGPAGDLARPGQAVSTLPRRGKRGGTGSSQGPASPMQLEDDGGVEVLAAKETKGKRKAEGSPRTEAVAREAARERVAGLTGDEATRLVMAALEADGGRLDLDTRMLLEVVGMSSVITPR